MASVRLTVTTVTKLVVASRTTKHINGTSTLQITGLSYGVFASFSSFFDLTKVKILQNTV